MDYLESEKLLSSSREDLKLSWDMLPGAIPLRLGNMKRIP